MGVGYGGVRVRCCSVGCAEQGKGVRVCRLTESPLLFSPSDSAADDVSLRPGAAGPAAAEGAGARPRTGHGQGTRPGPRPSGRSRCLARPRPSPTVSVACDLVFCHAGYVTGPHCPSGEKGHSVAEATSLVSLSPPAAAHAQPWRRSAGTQNGLRLQFGSLVTVGGREAQGVSGHRFSRLGSRGRGT